MIATVDMVRAAYNGVPEDGFHRDVECAASLITSLHKRTGMDFDQRNMLIKGLQIVRGPHCTQSAFASGLNQERLQNWETENFIVFENIYYGSYSEAIQQTMMQQHRFPVFICDQTKPHTRFFKAGLFQIVQNVKPDCFKTNCNGYTVRGYLLLQRVQGMPEEPSIAEKKQWEAQSQILSLDLNRDLNGSSCSMAPSTAAPLVGTFGAPPAVSEQKVQAPAASVPYKSLLEQKFAVFLQRLGLEFTYEKSMFALESYDRVPGQTHTYHPDFYLKKLRLHIELKPHYPHLEELDLCEQMAALGYDIVLMYGTDFVPLFQNFSDAPGLEKRHYKQRQAIRGMAWSGQTGQRLPGEAVFIERDGNITLECISISNKTDMSCTWTPKLLAAFQAAQEHKN